ncbi:MAG: hypothetical protein JO001_10005 [Alphaproteobacteria bacterium]|nr:hypothetical protein [Alphaproteobacteria bacterium]
MPSGPQDIPFLLQQVRKCLDLAKLCADAEIAWHLTELAREFAQRAIKVGADPSLIPTIEPASPRPDGAIEPQSDSRDESGPEDNGRT